MEYVRTAETPAGDRYMVVTAPPGFALDAGTGQTRGGLLRALLTVLTVVTRSMRRGWRVALTPQDQQGRPTGASHRERLANK